MRDKPRTFSAGKDRVSVDRSNWCASQWQAFVSRLPTAAQRRHAVENEVPEEMRERVISHLVTVRQIKMVAQKKQGR